MPVTRYRIEQSKKTMPKVRPKNKTTYKPTASTLIEVLVVISVTAMLISILIPALTRARLQSKAVVCQSKLRQWGLYFKMYTDDNDDSFNAGRGVDPWYQALKPYYQDANDLLLCTMAPNPDKNIWDDYVTFSTWGPIYFKGIYGSYGINAWVTNPPSSSPFNYKPENNWRTTNIKGTPFIPILLGAWWSEGWSEYHDTVPKYPGQLETITYDDMGHFCINRHQGHINVIFMDYSIRKVPLKRLWRLRWHRKYPLSAAPPADWNDPDHWMHGLPNY